MTIIAFRANTMAADTKVSWGSVKTFGERKIVVLRSCMVGFAGDWAACERFVAWLRRGRRGPVPVYGEHETLDALVAYKDGRLEGWDHKQTEGSLVKSPFFAAGAGSEMALGAMAQGASAAEAVAICIQWHEQCGGEVVTHRVRDIGKRKR